MREGMSSLTSLARMVNASTSLIYARGALRMQAAKNSLHALRPPLTAAVDNSRRLKRSYCYCRTTTPADNF